MNSIFSARPGTAKAGRRLLPLLAMLAAGPHAHGLTINATFDRSITGDAQAATIEATINSAIAVYETTFSDPITVNITFQEQSTGLGNSTTKVQPVPYSSYRSALLAHATSIDDGMAVTYLPNTANNPVDNNPNVYLSLALGRALGLTSAVGSPDGTIYLNTSICNLSPAQNDAAKYSLFAVVEHEIDEVLGSSSSLTGLTNGAPTPTVGLYVEDMFRYDQNGARSFTTAANAVAYFSLDGVTDLARFNQTQGGDYSDWYSPGGQTPQVQDAFGTPGSAPVLGVELRMLDALGYTRPPAPLWVDFNYNGTPAGTYAAPDKTLAAGVSAVNAGGTIIIKSGYSGETMTITKPMFISAFIGNANIGLGHALIVPLANLSGSDSPQTQVTPGSAVQGEIETTTGTMNVALPNRQRAN